MAFEVVVRPVIFPNIRPPKTPQPANAPDDPNADQCVITGSSGKSIDLPYSWSTSISQSKPTEIERRLDKARIYQMEVDGTINRDNFVDVEVANRIKMKTGKQPTAKKTPQPGDPSDVAVGYVGGQQTYYYRRQPPADNVEVRERDIISKNPDVAESE